MLLRLITGIALAEALVVMKPSLSYLKFRAARPKDVASVAELLTSTFEAVLPWWEFPERARRKSRYIRSVGQRIMNTSARSSYIAIVAELSGGEIVAFAEGGFLPAPPGSRTAAETAAVDSTSNLWGVRCPSDAPYIANLCVADKCRRKGVATRLVGLLSTWAVRLEYNEIFVAVESSNAGAQSTYKHLQFDMITPPNGTAKRNRLYYRRDLTFNS